VPGVEAVVALGLLHLGVQLEEAGHRGSGRTEDAPRGLVLVLVGVGEFEAQVQVREARLEAVHEANLAVSHDLYVGTLDAQLGEFEVAVVHRGLEGEGPGAHLREDDGVSDLGLAVTQHELRNREFDVALGPG
jgi:hypothetical protein